MWRERGGERERGREKEREREREKKRERERERERAGIGSAQSLGDIWGNAKNYICMYMCTYIYRDYSGLCKDYRDITPIAGNKIQKSVNY